MSNRENEAGKSGFTGIGLALALMATAAVIVLLIPSQANPEPLEASAAPYVAAADAGYLPAQIVNRGKEFEPPVEIYY
jgi:hypothetical protein